MQSSPATWRLDFWAGGDPNINLHFPVLLEVEGGSTWSRLKKFTGLRKRVHASRSTKKHTPHFPWIPRQKTVRRVGVLGQWYWWWKKSCTNWDVRNFANNKIFTLSAGAGFLASTIGLWKWSNILPDVSSNKVEEGQTSRKTSRSTLRILGWMNEPVWRRGV